MVGEDILRKLRTDQLEAKRILLYSLSLVLVVFYASILGLAMYPNVSAEYEAYYIDQTVDSWPGENGLEYELGTKVDFANDTFAHKGWYRGTSWGRWSKGKRAHLYFQFDENASSDLTMSFSANQFSKRQKVDVVVNGAKIETITVATDGWEFKEYRVVIPENIVKSNTKNEPTVDVTFVIHNPSSPSEISDSPDTRVLGIGIKWIKIDTSKKGEDI